MEIIVLSLLLLSLAFSLGFVLNRSSTCAVIAMTELLQERKPARFVAFFECTLWGALIYAAWQMTSGPQAHWSALAYTATGGVIFGVGAFVNGACAFGSVGHLGNGDTQFGFTFLGMYAVSTVASLANLLPAVMTSSMSLQVAAPVTLSMLVGFALLRFVIQRNNVTAYLKMTCAMLAIGVAYATIVLLKPGWSIAHVACSIASIGIHSHYRGNVCRQRWQSLVGERPHQDQMAKPPRRASPPRRRDADGKRGSAYPWRQRHAAAGGATHRRPGGGACLSAVCHIGCSSCSDDWLTGPGMVLAIWRFQVQHFAKIFSSVKQDFMLGII
ncbi:YeeE/YedE family protein (plasmid) [Aminobacter sp. NyZ550]|uniref:YeeE/YedE family protein n=1 Tax=Aminobacter sp. NyZ550 TaxID=2979870 RepID=UPI0021D5B90D|nr:YeeE/YedE family protein [Aminobacter sp. NyZ550]WAX98103.1 YeeE/YedE family protein [Aminobacter sp. NyZ550]